MPQVSTIDDRREAPPRDGETWLREFLADRDAPCPGCGYNLRGLRSDRCPECSQELELRVGLAEPKMRLWLLAVIGAAAGVGFNGLLLAYALIMIAQAWRSGSMAVRFIGINVAGLLVMGGVLVVLLRSGRRIRRLSTSGRAAIALGAWFLAMIDLIAFAVVIR